MSTVFWHQKVVIFLDFLLTKLQMWQYLAEKKLYTYTHIYVYTYVHVYAYAILDGIWKLIAAMVLLNINWALSKNGVARI